MPVTFETEPNLHRRSESRRIVVNKNGNFLLLLLILIAASLISSYESLGALYGAQEQTDDAQRFLKKMDEDTITIHMVTIADERFADRYGVYFDRMKVYAEKWGYTWAVLLVENYDEDVCPDIQP